MIIGLGCDHGGYMLKELIKSYLKGQKKYEVIDFGCNNLDSTDYPVYAKEVANAVSESKIDFGVLICTTGIGMSICANKVKGVRASLVFNEEMCALTRAHNDSNVLCIAGKYTDISEAQKYLDIFLNTKFEGGRHLRRINMMENNN